MQPFDKHPANVDSLESCGGELVAEGANGLQTGTRTRKAYQPAIDNIGGTCAPLLQVAGEPVDEASEAVNSSLIWAAVVSRYWGKQVKAFNAKVDEITSALVAQRPNFGVEVPTGPPSPGGPPDTSTEDIAEAMAAAIADAKHKWYQAYTQYIEDGGRGQPGGPSGHVRGRRVRGPRGHHADRDLAAADDDPARRPRASLRWCRSRRLTKPGR
jgi:hypothetical protein